MSFSWNIIKNALHIHKKKLFISIFILITISTFIFLFYTCSNQTSPDSYRTKLLEKMDRATSFSDFTNAFFCYEVTSDSVTTAYTLKNQDAYHIPSLPANLSSFRYQQYNTNKQRKTDEKRAQFLLNQLAQYNPKSLSTSEQLTYTLLSKQLSLNKELDSYAYYEDLLGATTGIQTNLPVTLGEYPIRNKSDIDIYLSLLKQIPAYFDNVILYEKHRQDLHFYTPDFLLRDTLDGLTTLITDLKKDNNCFVDTFESRILALPTLSEKARKNYGSKNQEYVKRYVIPSYQKLHDFVEILLENASQKRASANDSITSSQNTLKDSSSRNRDQLPDLNTAYGLSTLPQGSHYYELLVKKNTGSYRPIEELISMTEAALQSTLSNVLCIAQTDPKAYKYYCDNPLQSYYENPEAILEALSLLIREHYPLLSSTPTYTVKSVPNSLASHLSPAFYMIPAIDDFTNNTIYINTLYTNTESGNLFTTLAHEGFPGHLYQTVYFNNTKPSAIRHILDYPGYIEGWATYVEMNAFPYIHYPFSAKNLCALYQSDTLISLALSARVDFGVNYESWTLEDVNQFFENNGFKSYYAGDLYAYVVEAPATYLRYFIGYLEIEQLKNRYQNEKMENYSEKEFHKKLLDVGPCDFETLNKQILTNP